MKRKGTRAERELLHMFHDNGWIGVRSAGSGSTSLLAPDILVGNGKRYLAIECKSIARRSKYFYRDELKQVGDFGKKFGAESWIGIRFDKLKWFFIRVNDIKRGKKGKGKCYVITLDFARKKGLTFPELIGLYRQKRIYEDK
jgi:Holliday junction resolvase